MKITVKILGGFFSLAIVGLFLLWPVPSRAIPPQRASQAAAPVEASYNLQNTLLGQTLNSAAAQLPNQQGPTIGEPVTPGISPAARDLPTGRSEPLLNREINPRQTKNILNVDPNNPDPYDTGQPDPLVNRSHNWRKQTPALTTSFEGISLNTGGSGEPPDTVGEVGPNHYVQMVNSSFQIFDKNGNSLAGPTEINQLWQGQGDICEQNNDGDPIVLYDRQVDRWLLTQFSTTGGPPYGVCMAVSQTADPTGAYYIYTFIVPDFPDYLKFGVWPDAYYMGTNETSYTAYAFDRTNMLAGNTARPFVRFPGETNFLMPADLDGATLPPNGTPGYFYTFKDDNFHAEGPDSLEVFAFTVDFDTPANSTFTRVATLNIADFTYTVCGSNILECIPQPGTAQRLDAVSDWPMWRLQYRNFGAYETLVGNFTVDVGGDRAGIRWFELRKSGGGNWTLQQEGTYAPNASNHYWLGSIAMDRSGNIALGYSVSNDSNTFPSIRYTTRLASDPPGTFQAEATLIDGTASTEIGSNRWGDYSSMNVDPTDDCTFWYTNEYYTAGSGGAWQTRIGAFKVPSCGVTLDERVYLPIVIK